MEEKFLTFEHMYNVFFNIFMSYAASVNDSKGKVENEKYADDILHYCKRRLHHLKKMKNIKYPDEYKEK